MKIEAKENKSGGEARATSQSVQLRADRDLQVYREVIFHGKDHGPWRLVEFESSARYRVSISRLYCVPECPACCREAPPEIKRSLI